MKNIFLGSFISAFLLLSSGCKEGSGGSAGADNSGTANTPGVPGVPGQVPNPIPGESPASGSIKVSASGDDGYAPANTLDDSIDSESRWSASGEKEWIQYDLGSDYQLKGLDIAFYDAENRV